MEKGTVIGKDGVDPVRIVLSPHHCYMDVATDSQALGLEPGRRVGPAPATRACLAGPVKGRSPNSPTDDFWENFEPGRSCRFGPRITTGGFIALYQAIGRSCEIWCGSITWTRRRESANTRDVVAESICRWSLP
jgi:hypothetical protein